MIKNSIISMLLYAFYWSIFMTLNLRVSLSNEIGGLNSNRNWRNYRQDMLKLNNSSILNENSKEKSHENEHDLLVLQNQTNLNSSNESVLKNDANGTEVININNRFKFFSQLFDNFDRYTLIMITAFIMGILLIGILIAVSFCICKSITRIKHKNPSKITTNPAYHDPSLLDSFEKIEIQARDNPQTKDLKHDDQEIISLLNVSNKQEEEKPNLYGSKTFQSIDSTLSSSNLSFNSITKSPNRLNSTKDNSGINKSPIKNSLTNLSEKLNSAENPEKKKLIDDTEEVDARKNKEPNVSNFQARYTPSSSSKTKQQLQKESRPSLSRNSLYHRTTSESAESKETSQIADENLVTLSKASKRSSIASSISSIFNRQSTHSKLNFDLVDDEIENLVGNVKIPSASKSNLNESQTSVNMKGSKQFLNSSNSINNSFSDIYMKAINEKREENKRKANLNSNNDATTTPDGKINYLKRHSINNISSKVNSNPSGVNSKSKSDLNDNESINTYESEKSCY